MKRRLWIVLWIMVLFVFATLIAGASSIHKVFPDDDGNVTGPVTIISEFSFPTDESDLKRVWLTGFSTDAGLATQALALVWEKQEDRFGTWALMLKSDQGLVGGASGGSQRLASVLPTLGGHYKVLVSLDPAEPVLSVSINHTDDGKRAYGGEMRLDATMVPPLSDSDQDLGQGLHVWAGFECLGQDHRCHVAFATPQVMTGFVSVGLNARITEKGRTMLGAIRRLDRRQEFSVRLESQHQPRPIEVAILARVGPHFEEIARTTLTTNELDMGLPASSLPVGKADLIVRLSREGHYLDVDALPIEVGVVEAQLKDVTVDVSSGQLRGSLVVEADGQVQNVLAELSAAMTYDQWTGPRQTTKVESLTTLPATNLDIIDELIQVPFSFAIPISEAAGRIDVVLSTEFRVAPGVQLRPPSNYHEVILVQDVPSLAKLYEDDFTVGFATMMIPPEVESALTHHFNSLTPENSMKWEWLQRNPGEFNFERAEYLMEFAKQHDMEVIGHTLVWHQQTPAWVFQGERGQPATREMLIERMKTHIDTVVRHFCGRVRGWDVVNEALEEDGSLRQSPWLNIIGEDYIELAFRFAHEACPDAELYYNDYNLTTPAKRQGAMRIVKHLQSLGIPVHAVGEQAHYDVTGPSMAQVRATIEDLASLGVKVMISELDMSVYGWGDQRNVYTEGLPDTIAQQQAERYGALFKLFREYRDVIQRVTFWGTTDRYSWKNNFPVRGRTDHALLFDRDGHYKPAFWAVLDAGKETK